MNKKIEMDAYQTFIHKSRYARYLETEGRRETWEETVKRYVNYWRNKFGNNVISEAEFQEVEDAIYNMEVMPSMRALWAAGPALDVNPLRGYNCAFVAVNHPRAFDEILYALMSGTGMGFSCETAEVNKLPIINDNFIKTERVIVVGDSSEGWAKALRKLVADLYLGNEHQYDTSNVRPEGSRLVTMGGRSSGPEPLVALISYITAVFKNAAGRKLRPIEVHDIVCKIAEIVVVGGVRRSALISLSDLGDVEVRDAKSGSWWIDNSQRSLANNSAVYDAKPSMGVFMDEWVSLVKSGSGERGIFNRGGAKKMAPERRNADLIKGSNPCCEIILRSEELCNLSEIVARKGDTLEDLKRKMRIAAIVGTFQATLTDFKYVRKTWQRNCEEERLLGVSLTGIQDCELLQNPKESVLKELKEACVQANIEMSERLGINPATAVTTIKPSGTVSQLVNSASGIHGRFAPYYIRTVRQSTVDPLTQMLKDQGVPNEPDNMNPNKTTIFSFPVKSPKGAILANEQSAIEQLENWKAYQKSWSEHSVSVTVYVKEDEWLTVGAWVYDNFDYITGVSFLPYSEHTYAQAPYQPCSKEDYEAAVAAMPMVDFSKLSLYENEDNTEGSQTLACVGGGCDIL